MTSFSCAVRAPFQHCSKAVPAGPESNENILVGNELVRNTLRITFLALRSCVNRGSFSNGICVPMGPGSNFFHKKPTGLVANAECLRSLFNNCDDIHSCEACLINGKRVRRTKLAGAWLPKLCRQWGWALKSIFCEGDFESLRRWRRLVFRSLGGDIEMHPEPPAITKDGPPEDFCSLTWL